LVLTFLVLPFWYLLTRVDPDIFQTSSKTVVCVCSLPYHNFPKPTKHITGLFKDFQGATTFKFNFFYLQLWNSSTFKQFQGPEGTLWNNSKATVITASERAHIGVCMVNKNGKSWQDLADHFNLWWWFLASTQVHHDPRHITQERERNCGSDERDKRLYYAKRNDIVATMRTVT